MSTTIPAPGDWPCQQEPAVDPPPRLLAFLYLLLRDGMPAPGDVEGAAINVSEHHDNADYTNDHLEGYARALCTHLLDGGPSGPSKILAEAIERHRDARWGGAEVTNTDDARLYDVLVWWQSQRQEIEIEEARRADH